MKISSDDYSRRVSTDARPNVLLLVLIIIGSIANMDRAITSLILEPLKHEFKLSDTWVGLISGGSFAVVYSLSSIPLARIADRTNRKGVLFLCFAIWVAMMLCCGLATSALWLLVARMGVGVGEAGIIPTSHSMMPDAFPPSGLASAFATYSLSTILAAPIALSLGGWIVESFGWRSVFICTAAVSVPIGIGCYLLAREPTRHVPLKTVDKTTKPAGRAAVLGSKSGAFTLIIVGGVGYSLFIYGPIAFIPPFLLRSTTAGIVTVGWALGLATTVAGIVGAIVGAIVADHLTAKNARWLLYMPALGLVASLPVAIVAFLCHGFTTIILLIGLLYIILYAAIPPLYAAIQELAAPQNRATSIAIYFATVNLLGMTLGPLATGFISDMFAPARGRESLRIAIVIGSWILLPAIAALLIAARLVPKEPLSNSLDDGKDFRPQVLCSDNK